jgi:hypothetical protein
MKIDTALHNNEKRLNSSLRSVKKNLKFFFGFSDPANFLHQQASSLKKNHNFFFGFSDPANFLHQPASSLKKNLKKILCISQRAPSKRILNLFWVFRSRQFSASATAASDPPKRILNFFLGFQIPPILCISQRAPSKRILKCILGFQIPPIFCISQR